MDFIMGEISACCYMVKAGKPAAAIPLQSRFLDKAVAFIEKEYGLRVYIEELFEGWLTLWIYKHSYILEIIKTAPSKPETVFDHWVLGKLFGYDESSIGEFLATRSV